MRILVVVPLLLLLSIARHSCANDEAPIDNTPSAATASTQIDGSDELVFHALAFLGVKYRYGGNSPDTGWDCSGYVFHVFKQGIGVVLPRDSFAMSERGETIIREDLRPGDLVFFNTLNRAFSHVGIYLGDNRFIHAPSTGKVVQISDMNSNYWARRFNGGRRIFAEK
jgi:cell wall-associated NlpC family hydrolase